MTDRAPRWHITRTDLADYAAGTLTAPRLWSAEAHLGACATCRHHLAEIAGRDLVDAGWNRLDTALDAPVPGVVERLLVALGVPEHTGRLLAATPALRASWLVAVALTLSLAALLAQAAHPAVFLASTPLLPLIGVAASFGPRIDPTYEVTVVAPIHTFRLLLLRCVAVLSVNTGLAAVASMTMTAYGLTAVGWFLPSLALTVLALVLTPRLGPVRAAAVVGLGWAGLVVATGGLGSVPSALFAPAGQLAIATAAAAAAVTLRRQAARSDTASLFTAPLLRRSR